MDIDTLSHLFNLKHMNFIRLNRFSYTKVEYFLRSNIHEKRLKTNLFPSTILLVLYVYTYIYFLIIIIVIKKLITVVPVVAMAAPLIPKTGISKTFRIIFNTTHTIPIRKGIWTFPMLESVSPTAENDAPIINPRSNINSGMYDA